MLELRGVNVFYGAVQALREVSLRVDEGEIVTLIGANGAGKSTTLMAMSGIVPPRRGEILFEGRPIHGLAPDRIVRLGLYLTDLSQFAAVNAVMQEYFSAPYPARSTIGVSALPKGVSFEADAVMVLD